MTDENRKPLLLVLDIEDPQALREMLQHLAAGLDERSEPLPTPLPDGASRHRPIVACICPGHSRGAAVITGVCGIDPGHPIDHLSRHREPMPLVLFDEGFSSSDPHEILPHLRENFCESARLEHSRLFSRLLEEVGERLQISMLPTLLPIRRLADIEPPTAFYGIKDEKKKLSRQMRRWRREKR